MRRSTLDFCLGGQRSLRAASGPPLDSSAHSRGSQCAQLPETRNPKPEILNLNPESRNPRPKTQTRISKPETRNPKPETQIPKPESRIPKPKTRNRRQLQLDPAESAEWSRAIKLIFATQWPKLRTISRRAQPVNLPALAGYLHSLKRVSLRGGPTQLVEGAEAEDESCLRSGSRIV